MLQIGICDDKKEMRYSLYLSLEKFLDTREMTYNIFEFSRGEGLIDWYKKNMGKLDLIFLDIEMDGINGLETAKEIRVINESVEIVFLTSHPDFVFEGYSVSALDYVMKPIKPSKIEEIVLRTLSKMQLNMEDTYTIKNKEGIYRLPKSTILYFTSEKRQIICVTKDKEYIFYGKLNDLEEEVASGFLRIHQRYLVNVDYISLFKSDYVEINGQVLPISRSYEKEVMKKLSMKILGE